MASTTVRQTAIQRAKLIVVKMGTNVVTGPDGRLDRRLVARLAGQIAEHHAAGRRFVVVSSGAIGLGMGEMGMTRRPRAMHELQALAAIGQRHLMTMFAAAFRRHDLHAAQLLLTRDDFDDRARYLNIRGTIAQLHRFAAIPVINENDPIAVHEIRFGDNDIIAALTANLLRADLTIILTVVEGLLDAAGQVVDLVERVCSDVTRLAMKTKSSLGSGGMRSKLDAIRMVTDAGELAMIANGRRTNVLADILGGQRVGTVFLPAARKLTSRHRWIGLTARPAGSVTVDPGAARAIVENHKSLLPGGVLAVSGNFERDDVIAVLANDGAEIARGIARYSADEIARIKGCRSSQIAQRLGLDGKCGEEIIHRDWLVVLAEASG